MPGRRSTAFAAGVIMLASVGLSACGGSSSSSSSTTTSFGTPSASDATKARRINLRLSDFPAGWHSTKATPLTQGPGFQEFLACLHVADPTTRQTADVSSPNFSPPAGPSGNGGIQASSEVVAYTDSSTAQTVYGVLSGSNVPGCIQSALSKEAESTSTFPRGAAPSIAVSSVTPPPAGGDPASAYQATITVKTQSGTVPAGQGTIVFFLHRRALVEANTLGLLGQTFPSPLGAGLVSTLANRAGVSRL